MIIVAEDPYWKPVEWKESTKRDSSWAQIGRLYPGVLWKSQFLFNWNSLLLQILILKNMEVTLMEKLKQYIFNRELVWNIWKEYLH